MAQRFNMLCLRNWSTKLCRGWRFFFGPGKAVKTKVIKGGFDRAAAAPAAPPLQSAFAHTCKDLFACAWFSGMIF